METNGFPLFGLTLAGSRSTAGFAHPAGSGGAKRCFAKPRLRPAAGLLSCVAKKVGKEATPASPVIRFADDSPALLASDGRRRTRPLRGLKQLRRKAPPNAPLLGGSEGAFRNHRALQDGHV